MPGPYRYEERRKVTIELEVRGGNGPTRNELPEGQRLDNDRLDRAVERTLRRLLKRMPT